MIVVDGPVTGAGETCETILRALPNWFGIETAIQAYIADANSQPTFVARINKDPAGFLTLMEHTPYAAEIHEMGVLPEYHRQGVGRILVESAETYLKQKSFEYLQVKTLSDKHPDPGYTRTRAFYLALGFRPLQEFPELWGPENPALQLIKAL